VDAQVEQHAATPPAFREVAPRRSRLQGPRGEVPERTDAGDLAERGGRGIGEQEVLGVGEHAARLDDADEPVGVLQGGAQRLLDHGRGARRHRPQGVGGVPGRRRGDDDDVGPGGEVLVGHDPSARLGGPSRSRRLGARRHRHHAPAGQGLHGQAVHGADPAGTGQCPVGHGRLRLPVVMVTSFRGSVVTANLLIDGGDLDRSEPSDRWYGRGAGTIGQS
jgi:hypothetical protein